MAMSGRQGQIDASALIPACHRRSPHKSGRLNDFRPTPNPAKRSPIVFVSPHQARRFDWLTHGGAVVLFNCYLIVLPGIK